MIPFIDLARQQERILPKLERRIKAVLGHGKYIMGPEVGELEEKLAAFAGARHAVTCSSGTDALLMPLMAYGIGPGDAVFTSPFTFIATAEVISLLGATPVFVDIDPDTYNIDPAALEKAIRALKEDDPSLHPLPSPKMTGSGSPRLHPRGIIPVDLFGLPADYAAINAMAGEHGLFVLEDAAQSFGAVHHGIRTGALSHVAATSFFPAKPLGCYGDGGAVLTDDDNLANHLRSIRVHGQGDNKYDNVRIGINGRLDTLQAAVLLEKLSIFPGEIESRNRVAARYTQGLQETVKTPVVPDGLTSVWAQYSILSEARGALQEALKQAGIPTAIYYPKPLHLQEAFSGLGYRTGDFPISEEVSRKIFSLPMHPYLEDEEIDHVISVIKNNSAKEKGH